MVKGQFSPCFWCELPSFGSLLSNIPHTQLLTPPPPNVTFQKHDLLFQVNSHLASSWCVEIFPICVKSTEGSMHLPKVKRYNNVTAQPRRDPIH